MNTTTPEPAIDQAVASKKLSQERLTLVYNLRNQGLKFKEIGKRVGVGTQRAAILYSTSKRWMNRKPRCTDGLSVRTLSCLYNCNINSRQKILKAYQSGLLKPTKYPRNYGWKRHKEVAKWLGLPEPQKTATRAYLAKICPHCGGKLS